jgi:hypothetical protein
VAEVVDQVWVRDREHDGEKMTGTNYRLPMMASVDPGGRQDHAGFEVITEMPVKSLITRPAEGFVWPADKSLEIRGFAWSGHFRRDCRGLRGRRPTLEASGTRTCGRTVSWQRFRCTLKSTRPGTITVLARATNAAGRSQPLDGPPWNPRGYCNNTVHRVVGERERGSKAAFLNS